MTILPDSPDRKSPGHIVFAGDFEFYDRDGEVYRAPVGNVFDVRSGYRIGRWECSRSHFDRHRAAITGEDRQ